MGAGQDRFRSIVRSYYRGSAAALLVYDVTSRSSFNHVLGWLKEAREYADSTLIVTLVGNKCDKPASERQVTYQEGYEVAQREGLQFVETSAVTGENVDDCFIQTANIVYSSNVLDKAAGHNQLHGGEQLIPTSARIPPLALGTASGGGAGGAFPLRSNSRRSSAAGGAAPSAAGTRGGGGTGGNASGN